MGLTLTNSNGTSGYIRAYHPEYLLDLVPSASFAFSFRRLASPLNYTGSSVRVRRSSDNSEADIGFDSRGQLNIAALSSFLGGAVGYVTTMYDQSGNANHAIQSVASKQTILYVSSKSNGKPTLSGSSNTTCYPLSTNLTYTSSMTYVGVSYVGSAHPNGWMAFGATNAGGDQSYLVHSLVSTVNWKPQLRNTSEVLLGDPTSLWDNPGIDARQQDNLFIMGYSNARSDNWAFMYYNTSSFAYTNPNKLTGGSTEMHIKNLLNGYSLAAYGLNYDAEHQDFILYPYEITGSNLTSVRNNINNHYAIW